METQRGNGKCSFTDPRKNKSYKPLDLGQLTSRELYETISFLLFEDQLPSVWALCLATLGSEYKGDMTTEI